MNARGIPPAVYWVLLLLSYLDRPVLTWPGGIPDQGTPLWLGYPPVLTWLGGGYLTRVPPGRVPHWQGSPPAGYPLAGYPPGWTWEGTPPTGPGRVPPPSVCPMAFWEMLQNIMGYGYPPPRCGQTENITFPILRMRAVMNGNRILYVCLRPRCDPPTPWSLSSRILILCLTMHCPLYFVHLRYSK